ncbi:helix-turn-helix domain-containing protein [Christensenellaceae bacterium OttesenSCG-928-L17]|nr:helix-turn-helix domain-containing protein [Christensenellaceae bacterium OttesenSCG-928-L17]
MMQEKLTLSVKEMADLIGISVPRAYDLTHVEGFPVIILGKRRVIHKERFMEWLNDNAGKIVM